MRHFSPLFLFFAILKTLTAQTTVYRQDFKGLIIPALPTDWSSNNATTESSSDVGYLSTGDINLLMADCQPSGQNRTVTVSGIITSGWAGITVNFAHRRTDMFTAPVSLDWSNDGSTWNPIAYSIPNSGSTWSTFTSSTLPIEANNQPNLWFRWSWTTISNGGCGVPRNYRIDEFNVIAATLPVSLKDFTVAREDNNIRILFASASERNNAHFAIERSSDGRSFSEIGRLAGAGNSNETKTYTFTDERPLRGLNYYRLKQTDFDGTYTYSPIRSATFGAPGRLTLSPSPANSWIHVQYEAPAQEEGVWQVFDAAGRILLSGVWEAENLSQDIELSGLPQGVYIFRLAAGKVFEARPFVAR
jgi:hypothetical protein